MPLGAAVVGAAVPIIAQLRNHYLSFRDIMVQNQNIMSILPMCRRICDPVKRRYLKMHKTFIEEQFQEIRIIREPGTAKTQMEQSTDIHSGMMVQRTTVVKQTLVRAFLFPPMPQADWQVSSGYSRK